MSCERQSTFSEEELAFISAYTDGDTIYFINAENDVDTIAISSHCNQQEPESFDKRDTCILFSHLPVDHYRDSFIRPVANDTLLIYDQPLVWIHKRDENNTFYTFEFKDLRIDYCDNCKSGKIVQPVMLNNFRLANYYTIENRKAGVSDEGDNDDIKTLYWTDSLGLTAYSTYGGKTWTYLRKARR